MAWAMNNLLLEPLAVLNKLRADWIHDPLHHFYCYLLVSSVDTRGQNSRASGHWQHYSMQTTSNIACGSKELMIYFLVNESATDKAG
jgi:hypothetical protein